MPEGITAGCIFLPKMLGNFMVRNQNQKFRRKWKSLNLYLTDEKKNKNKNKNRQNAIWINNSKTAWPTLSLMQIFQFLGQFTVQCIYLRASQLNYVLSAKMCQMEHVSYYFLCFFSCSEVPQVAREPPVEKAWFILFQNDIDNFETKQANLGVGGAVFP